MRKVLLALALIAALSWWATDSVLRSQGRAERGRMFPDGTAAAPSVTFASDVDTGFYSIAANRLGIAVAGAAQWEFDAQGDLITAADSGNNIGVAGNRPADIIISDNLITGAAVGGTNQAGAIFPGSNTNAALSGTATNGQIIYCSDCTIANPCAGGGTGAIAKRLNGVWVCN